MAGSFIPTRPLASHNEMKEASFDIRRLPLLWPVLLWMAGIALARSDVVPLYASAIILLLLALLLLFLRKFQLVLVLFLGALWGAGSLLQAASDMAVSDSWLSKSTTVSAKVEKVEKAGSSSRLLLTDIRRSDGAMISGKALLYLYGEREALPLAGQQVEAVARWRLPRNYRNPGAFDYKGWCFDRSIALIGSARGAVRITDKHHNSMESARGRIRRAADASREHGGVLYALLLGERNRVEASVSRLFSVTGTAHLLAISGMHVGMVAAWIFALLWWILTRREAWIVHLPIRTIALSGGLIGAMSYATLAGWPLPAVRATLMLSAGVLAWQLASKHEPLNILLAALGLILLFDASAVASISLWLSFLATAALLLWGRRVREGEASLLRRLHMAILLLLWSSLLALLATLPIVVSTFGTIPVYGLFANLFMVPLYGLFVLPSALLGEFAAVVGAESLATWFMVLSGFGVETGVEVIDIVSRFPAGSLYAAVPPLWLSLIYAAGIVGAGALWFKRKAWSASACAVLVLGGYLSATLYESDVVMPTWVVWDVGQGASSTLLLPGREVITVDVPGYEGSRFNGGTTVSAGLRSLGVLHTDVLVISHAQFDHLGGAKSLIEGLNGTGELWLPDVPAAREHRYIDQLINSGDLEVRWLARGDSIEGKGYMAEVLWPPRGHAPRNNNNGSLVLRVVLENGTVLLLPGDIEKEVERKLVADIKPVDAMLMPHHGSRSSSTDAFVMKLAPRLAIAQTGLNNHYGFPKQQVVSRYRKVGATIANSAEGAVMVDLSAMPRLLQEKFIGSSRRDLALQWWQQLWSGRQNSSG